MPSNIAGVAKLSEQIHTPLIDYSEEAKLKLKQSNRWAKRGRLEIIAEILCYCSQQKSKTNIMCNVNLNHTQLKKYLKFLMSQRLLMVNRNKFVTTRKGHCFIELFVQLSKMLES
jgi:predicted transcriptional regulator